MSRCLRNAWLTVALTGGALALSVSTSYAQQRVVRVVGDDGQPVSYANVTLTGERPKITNERGDVEIGSAARASLTVDVRRLGYEPWFGTVTMGDTVTTATVTLHRISRRLFTVKITDTARVVPTFLRGFYERMLARQRGIGSGIYLTPEEVDKRSTNMATSLLQGLNGVSLQHTSTGKIIVMNANGSCQMTVLIDGHRVCAEDGCDGGAKAPPPPPVATPTGSPSRRNGRTVVPRGQTPDADFVLVDNLVSVNEIAAIEVYPRGATIPPSLPSVDATCGLVAFWTGGRKAP
jgi:hypothetical protein